jgi:hypothetical protein
VLLALPLQFGFALYLSFLHVGLETVTHLVAVFRHG